MDFTIPQLNLVIAWLWIVVGFVAGMGLGLFFRREDWLGGYASFRRRMYRLAHISFFGLGAVNLLFYLTTRTLPLDLPLAVASRALIVGAISMPICCVTIAHLPKAHLLFTVPVVSLIAGAAATLMEVIKL